MEPTAVLQKIIDGHTLSTRESQHLLLSVIAGKVTAAQTGAMLTVLHMRGETVEEIAGFIQVMRAKMTTIAAPGAVDVCGTGGDGKNSFNVSTAVALVVAGAGVKVVKHGNRAASSQCGSADVLEELGVELALLPR